MLFENLTTGDEFKFLEGCNKTKAGKLFIVTQTSFQTVFYEQVGKPDKYYQTYFGLKEYNLNVEIAQA